MSSASPAIGTENLQRTSIRARLVRVVRNAPSLMWLSDGTGARTYVNRKWLAFTGRRLKDELGNDWLDALHPDDRESCLNRYQTALRDCHPFTIEYRLRRADGEYRWICDYAVPLYEEYGPFAGYIGTCVDITDPRERTADRQREVEHLRLVAANTDEMIYRLRVAPTPRLEYTSPGVVGIMGITAEEFLNDPDAGLTRVHPDDRDRLREMLETAPHPNSRIVLRWRHPDGRIVWAEHRRLPVYDHTGTLVAVDGVVRDITRQKELETERDAQIALLNGLIGHMSDGVLAETDDGDVAVVNASFYRVFGIPADATDGDAPSLRGRALARLCDGARCGSPTGHVQPGMPLSELRLADDRTLEQEYFSIRLEDSRVIHIWQFRDITTRKREEEELRTSRHSLRDFSAHLEAAREEERRELARALHDEVGQLLTGIRLEVAAAVERFMAAPTPATFPVVDRLQAAVGLVDLSIATVRRITTALRPPILDHLGLLSAIRWEAAVFERRTGIRCRVSSNPQRIESRQHITVLYRILLEALTNVARHANAGTVWIRLRQRSGRLMMEVRDNGRGISDEVLKSGNTMGLLGMRERALAVGGEVRVTRLRAGGTSVTAIVPLVPSPSDGEIATAPDA